MNEVLREDFNDIYNDINIDFNLFNNKTILVTGATGFIGSLIIKYLLYLIVEKAINIKIIVTARNKSKLESIFSNTDISKMQVFIGDLTDCDFATDFTDTIKSKVDYIIHTAAITASKEMITKPIETVLLSIYGTNSILKIAALKKISSFVYLSSMEMYGSFEKNDDSFCTEDDLGYINPLNVRSNYPESKRMCENLCIAYYSEKNVPVKIARLSQVFGAGVSSLDNRLYLQIAKSVINKKNITLYTDGLSEGNYCYSSDAIRALFTLLFYGENGEAYNIVNEDTHCTVLEMANMVFKEIGHNEIKVIFEKNNINHGFAPKVKLKLSSEKIKQLNWNPKWNLKEMYIRMIDYLENSKK